MVKEQLNDSPILLKKESETSDDSNDVNVEAVDNRLLKSISPLFATNTTAFNYPDTKTKPVTDLVRRTYLAQLHKNLVNNYRSCHKRDVGKVIWTETKKLAHKIELNITRSSLESNLYRHNILKIIANIKAHTAKKEEYSGLTAFLKKLQNKTDVDIQKVDRHRFNTSLITQDLCIVPHLEVLNTALPTVNFNFHENNNTTDSKSEGDRENIKIEGNESNDSNSESQNEKCLQETANKTTDMKQEENSQDSLLNNLQTLFCESEDSSDIMTLIEKHSISTDSISSDTSKESQTCSEMDAKSNQNVPQDDNNLSQIDAIEAPKKKRKINLDEYKKRKQNMIENTDNTDDSANINESPKQHSNSEEIEKVHDWRWEHINWFVTLRTKMSELWMDALKCQKIRWRFEYLFGSHNTEEETTIPYSNLPIQEFQLICKQRISNWVVKDLMPFYREKKIKNRGLFKQIAKYNTNMIIMKDPIAERKFVKKYIEDYLKNKKSINTERDIYL